MIDPKRKAQNDARAKRLQTLMREQVCGIAESLAFGEPKSQPIEVIAAIHRALGENRDPARQFNGFIDHLLPPLKAWQMAHLLVEQAIEPLRIAIAKHRIRSGTSPVRAMHGKNYELVEPRSYDVSQLLTGAPLAANVCGDFYLDTCLLDAVVHEPGSNKPLKIERSYYARERLKLLELESWLWEISGAHGGGTGRIPYACRMMLLITTWHPVAHEPPGAWTICIRCGELLFRKKRPSASLPRCPVCMKETSAQREWPAHALAPDRRGTWFLHCQYPDCKTVVDGPRQRKYCDAHMSAKLSPRRRPASLQQHTKL